ncbi:MAG TPA: heme-copper oxidase subunit III [Polyangiaceae bacterium]|nr:heme-copper oxidase subunit III [Polyangiaceae bacterium]
MRPTSGKTLAPTLLAEQAPEEHSLEYSGMVIFLGSWAMMFGALFFSYAVLRISAPVWPAPGFARLPLVLPGINTLLLLTSSRTLSVALARLRRGQLERCRNELLLTIALGSAFVALQCKVWVDLWQSGLRLDSGAYGGTFYLLTVFHILHVLVGLGLLGRLLAPLARRNPVAPGRVSAALTAMFWHFVDAVWLTMFVAVYIL